MCWVCGCIIKQCLSVVFLHFFSLSFGVDTFSNGKNDLTGMEEQVDKDAKDGMELQPS